MAAVRLRERVRGPKELGEFPGHYALLPRTPRLQSRSYTTVQLLGFRSTRRGSFLTTEPFGFLRRVSLFGNVLRRHLCKARSSRRGLTRLEAEPDTQSRTSHWMLVVVADDISIARRCDDKLMRRQARKKSAEDRAPNGSDDRAVEKRPVA
jgi:hypothetical protein